MKHENLVLSNELIKVELPPLMIWKAEVSAVSPSSVEEHLNLQSPGRELGSGFKSRWSFSKFPRDVFESWKKKRGLKPFAQIKFLLFLSIV